MKLYSVGQGAKKSGIQGMISAFVTTAVTGALLFGFLKNDEGMVIIDNLAGFLTFVAGVGGAIHMAIEQIRNWLKVTKL